MSNRLSFGRGQAYLGTNADQPPNWNFNNRDPSVYDTQNVSIGDLWMNTIAERIWCLVSLEGSPTSKGALATWLPLGGGFGNGILLVRGGRRCPSIEHAPGIPVRRLRLDHDGH